MLSLWIASSIAMAPARAEPTTRVFLNGTPIEVHFNDGDTFRVLEGPLARTQARIAGMNTLESYGPIHRFGAWHPKELYVLAKMAMVNAQNGVWRCLSDKARDTYGRILATCDDLAIDQIARGLAHAMSVDASPARPEYLAAQRIAMEARRGMWAHGRPAYLVTSLHSITEDFLEGTTYNRLVSTEDGHSAGWIHGDRYGECEEVCSRERPVDERAVADVGRRAREDVKIAPALASIDDPLLFRLVRDFAALGFIPEIESLRAARAEILTWLSSNAIEEFPKEPFVEGSCSLYVSYDRRTRQARPWCLR